MALAACSSGFDEAPEADQVGSMCDAIVAIHSDIIDAANDMAAQEAAADPAARAAILARGIDTFADLAEAAGLPTEPASLVAGLDARREKAVADMRAEAAAFRAEWSTVDLDERAAAVNRVFLAAERLMSELEPRITPDTPDDVIAAARSHEACRFVIQLPPQTGGS